MIHPPASNTAANKKQKKSDTIFESSMAFQNTLNVYRLERMKAKDYTNKIRGIEHQIQFNESRLVTLVGLMIQCDETSNHYSKLQHMYDEANVTLNAAKVQLVDVNTDYDIFKYNVENTTKPPGEVVCGQPNGIEIISILEDGDSSNNVSKDTDEIRDDESYATNDI